MWSVGPRSADVVIMTTSRTELDAVLAVDTGAMAGSAWARVVDDNGLETWFRSFTSPHGRSLHIAVAQSPAAVASQAAMRLTRLVDHLRPQCIAMCGSCAGRPGKTQLGDVIAVDKLYYHDTGKRTPTAVLQDLSVYPLYDDWKLALQDFAMRSALGARRFHVAPMASGSQLIEDPAIWDALSATMYTVQGIDTSAAVLGEVAHAHRNLHMAALVMKGVAGFADRPYDDVDEKLASRISAEYLLEFLRQIMTAAVARLDDIAPPSGPRIGEVVAPPPRPRLPSYLLDARNEVVPWHDGVRDDALAALDTWADDESRLIAVRLLHAEGGTGKTRLVLEWTARRARRGDAAWFVVAQPQRDWLAQLCGRGASVAVVAIDYAERRADLGELLEQIAAHARRSQRRTRLRVLLLARGDGEWWSFVGRRSPAVAALLADAEMVVLRPIATALAQRKRVFIEAVRRFAEELRCAPPVYEPALEDSRFERVLYLHMAALAAVLGVPFTSSTLMDTILEHEERFWRDDSAPAGMHREMERNARQVIAAATLRGGLATERDARDVCRRLFERDRSFRDDMLLTQLHDRYTCGEAELYLPGLAPDLLGEAMVARTATLGRRGPTVEGEPGWIDRVFCAGDRDDALVTGFVVLGQISVSSPDIAQTWITRMLETELPARATSALRAVKQVGLRTSASLLGDLLGEAVDQRGDLEIAHRFAQEGLASTRSLQRATSWWIDFALRRIADNEEPHIIAARAGLLSLQSDGLAARGHRMEAAARAVRSVEVAREAADRDPALRGPLTDSLIHLGQRLGDIGDFDRSIAVLTEALSIRRALRERDPEGVAAVWLAHGAWALGSGLLAAGRPNESRLLLEEAVARYRVAVVTGPLDLKGELAGALQNLGVAYRALGDHASALAASAEAARDYGELAHRNPDRYEASLPDVLTNFAIDLQATGQHDLALEISAESERRCLHLFERTPTAMRRELARVLNNRGAILFECGRHAQAFDTWTRAVEHQIVLAQREGASPRPLADALVYVASSAMALERWDDAYVALKIAGRLYSSLRVGMSSFVLPELVYCQADLARLHQRFEHTDDALDSLHLVAGLLEALPDDLSITPSERVRVRRELSDGFAACSASLATLGRPDEAAAADRDAARQLAIL